MEAVIGDSEEDSSLGKHSESIEQVEGPGEDADYSFLWYPSDGSCDLLVGARRYCGRVPQAGGHH